MSYKKEEYHKFTNLYVKQNWLISKRDELNELIEFCETSDRKDLVFSLLERFHYLNNESLSIILNDICSHVINESGFEEGKTQLLSLTYNDEADSGQKILDNIKVPFFQQGWRSLKTVNQFGKSVKNYNKGRTQIVIIDEFIGSGQTLNIRLDYLSKNIKGEFELICCFVAGIKETINMFEKKGYKVFCPLQLDKGISEYYHGDDLDTAESLMLELELKLAQRIKEKELYDYSFGYGAAEALYSMEGCNGNTPNSVFPIFWWLEDENKNIRNTLLTRFETGF